MENPKTIFLEPVCPCGHNVGSEGRLWCEDDVWSGDDCPECGEELPDAAEYRRVS